MKGKITKLSYDEALNIIKAEPQIMRADVREADEYAAGHLEGAINMPLSRLAAETEKYALSMLPDKTADIIVYCQSGRRSAIAADMLKSFGYLKIYDMGGMMNWPEQR